MSAGSENMSILRTIKDAFTPDGWRYRGITNSLMNKHEWTNGGETVSVYWKRGAPGHSGLVAEVTGREDGVTLKLSNGFIQSLDDALILADLHMREDSFGPSAFMASDRVESDYGPGNLVRQDEWLRVHGDDYEFAVIDPSELDTTRTRP